MNSLNGAIDAYEILCLGRDYTSDMKPPKTEKLLGYCTHGVIILRTTNNKVHTLSWGNEGLTLDVYLTEDPTRDFAVAGTHRLTLGFVGFVARGKLDLPKPVKLQDIWQWAVDFDKNTKFKPKPYKHGMCVCGRAYCVRLCLCV
jgi:hypothetical protein